MPVLPASLTPGWVRRFHGTLTALLLGAGGSAIAATPVTAQIMHLPPAHRRVLRAGEVVLTIKPTTSVTREYKALISVDDDRITVQSDGATSVVPLGGGRSIRDVINQLLVDSKNQLEVVSKYPLYAASYVGSLDAKMLVKDGVIEIPANSDEPDLRLGFGVVMALAQPDPDKSDGGILAQGGFQLDVVGTHQMIGAPAKDDTRWLVRNSPLLYTQWRLGLNADQQVQVEKDPATGAALGASAQFEAALAQADQVAVSGQFDMEFPNVSRRIAFVLSPSIGISWTRLQVPPLPAIRVGSDLKPAADVFSTESIAEARTSLARILPLSEFGLMGTLQYRRRNVPLYYVGAGVMTRELAVPRVGFQRQPPPNGAPTGTPAGDPVAGSLRASLERAAVPIWRATMGARLAGVLDVRLDASGSRGRERTEPLLRLLIARAFPIGG